jgi:hypothetical protein
MRSSYCVYVSNCLRSHSCSERQKQKTKFKNQTFVNDVSSLEEYELEEIVSHYKEGNKSYRYIVKWKDPTIPNSEASAADLYSVHQNG